MLMWLVNIREYEEPKRNVNSNWEAELFFYSASLFLLYTISCSAWKCDDSLNTHAHTHRNTLTLTVITLWHIKFDSMVQCYNSHSATYICTLILLIICIMHLLFIYSCSDGSPFDIIWMRMLVWYIELCIVGKSRGFIRKISIKRRMVYVLCKVVERSWSASSNVWMRKLGEHIRDAYDRASTWKMKTIRNSIRII